MDSSTSDASQDSSDSSSADSTSADSPMQALPTMSETQDPAEMASSIDNDSDSDSDISMSAETDDEEDSRHQGSIIVVNPGSAVAVPSHVENSSKKRKFSDSAGHSNGQPRNGMIDEVRKRLKPDDAVQNYWTPDGRLRKDKSLLPAEIWHHIFTFCPARSLGCLMQVNKTFNMYLDPSSLHPPWVPLSKSALWLLSSDNIWRYSRQAINMHGLPTPLSGKSELEMWRMACGSLCQFCGTARQANLVVDQWHPGPGEKGVIPVWSFGIRTCGPCLLKQSTKEIDLLLSSAIPSPLMAALPFIFLTNELHVLSSAALQNGQHPSSLQITKHFYNFQVEEIKKEFEDVKAMGSAAAEEWLKGLEGRGRERRNDASRWERWEASGGIARMLGSGKEASNPIGSVSSPPSSNLIRATNGNLPPHPGNNPLFSTNQTSQLPLPLQNGFDLATNPPPRFDSPAQNGFAQYAPRPPPQTKHERTKEEVAELKAARRAEIERRCLLLDPPIAPGVLAHMPSFQAAIQIIQPIVDSSWEVLKPRLISQREDAEQRENDRLAQTRVVQERFDERRFQDMQSRSDSKDLVEREWDDMQAPLRARIGGYADEIVRDGWNGGEKVSYETSPLFAAEVLIYVRKRFYAEVAKDEAAIRATGREPELDPANGPFTRKLILENMKWVFDTKIKPYTEQYRKELFLCNACEYANKYYGFEGVIQHFAAKHTSALSVGSVVVHWKSEWPEYPPFNPDPDNAVKPYYPAAPSATVPYSSSGPTTQQSYGFGGYPVPVSTPIPGPNPHVYQESPGPYYGHPQFGDQYSGHQNGPYAPPPQPYQDPSQAFQPQQYSVAPHAPSVTGYNDAPQDYSQNGYGAPYQPPQDMYANQAQQYPPPALEIPGQQASYDASAQYGYNQTPSYPNNFPPPPQKTEQYIAKLQDLARNARDIWNSIGSIKEVPGSLKVYTIIYHLLKRFRETYQEDPPLSMMVDGLSSNKDMRPVRNVNGLLCKACTLGMAGSLQGSQKKHYSFPQLVNHFHAIHDLGLTQNYGVPLDWTRDMVDLPDTAKLVAVANAPGMDEQKLALFTEAVPEIIPVPKPTSSDFHHEAHQQYGQYAPQTDYPELAPSQDNHDKYYAVMDNEKPLDSGSATFDNGEYDPRHPSDLPVDPRPLPKSIRRDRRPRQQSGARDGLPDYQYDERSDDQVREEPYAGWPERLYPDRRPSPSSRTIPAAEYGHVVVREQQLLQGRRIQYQEAPADVEYRVRRNPVVAYDDTEMVYPESRHRASNSRSYHSNRQAQPPVVMYETEVRDRPRPIDEATAQQSRIYEVVAQISQQAQQVREQQPAKEELADAGSEDGEVPADRGPTARAASLLPPDEASNAAQRFLDNFRPGEISSEAEAAVTNQKANEHDDDARTYRMPVESQRRLRAEYEEDDRGFVSTRHLVNHEVDDIGPNGYIIHERAPVSRPARAYAYGERYVSSVPEQGGQRDRSPELVDRRYKLNNVVYRDERQDSQGTRRTPSRYARYESVRLENDRARSRSPVYVKVGTHTAQYRELSPGPHPAHSLRQEPIYRSRTPQQGAEEREIERAPRQEYYRVYADEPRPREPQYAEAFEYVRVSDPAGDYMIRRPVRREPEPVYATYEDDLYARQPVYESRAPAPRAAEPTFYEEEYDPRHPAPPPPPARQIRYQ